MAVQQSAAVEATESKDRCEVKPRHEDGSARSSRRWEYNEADWLDARVRGYSQLPVWMYERMNRELIHVLRVQWCFVGC
jgi:hypothetical protein